MAAAAVAIDDINAVYELLEVALEKNDRLDEFVILLSANAERRFKEAWRERILSQLLKGRLTPAMISNLVLLWHDEPATWIS